VSDIETVLKIGGSLLAFPEQFRATIAAIDLVARSRLVLVVPGGGPFADVVREFGRRLQLPDDTTHWMAVLAMDQYAHLLASQFDRGVVVRDCHQIAGAGNSIVPVLAPSFWLRERDPLPHSWNVTGDSIAAWVAGAAGARRLVLIKAPHAAGDDLLDPCFFRTLPEGVTHAIVTADRVNDLVSVADGSVERR
jgi:aspartokinase-like uncharacterized kinase